MCTTLTGAHSAVQSLERFVEQAKACVARSARNEPTHLALIQQLKPAAEFAKSLEEENRAEKAQQKAQRPKKAKTKAKAADADKAAE